MYGNCNCSKDNICHCFSDYNSETEDNCSYDFFSCDVYKNSPPATDYLEQCECCECTTERMKNPLSCEYPIEKKKLARGKFGLAYVIETPKQKITKPIGWQVEFQDTPSRVDNKCEKMVKWVNCPPLGECSDNDLSYSCQRPQNCAEYLKDHEKKTICKSKKCNPGRDTYVEVATNNLHDESGCSCGKNNKKDVCIICERCKINTSLSSPPEISFGDKSGQKSKKYKNRYCYAESPYISIAPRSSCKKDKHEASCLEHKNLTHCKCIVSNGNKLKCKYCNKDIRSDMCCSKCMDSKIKANFFQEGRKSESANYKLQDDLDYIPKKEKRAQNSNSKNETKYINKGVETKNSKELKPTVPKTENADVVTKRYFEKAVGDSTKSDSIVPKQTTKENFIKSENRKEAEEINKSLIDELQEKLAKNTEKKQAAEQKEGEGKETDTTINENSVENKDKKEKENSSESFKLLNRKNLTKKEIFSDDMTPLQKIKLAMKLQKQEIELTKAALAEPRTNETASKIS